MTRVDVIIEDIDRAQIVVAQSPTLTVLTSLVEVFGPLRGRLPLAVQRSVRSAGARVDLPLLAPALIAPRVPDALVPDTTGRATTAEELDRIRSQPDAVASQLAELHPGPVPAHLRPWLDRPVATLARYVDALQDYHRLICEEVYPGLEERLHRETAVLERALDAPQGRRFLSRVHPRVGVTAGGVTYESSAITGPDLTVRTQRLLLLPFVGDPRTFSSNVYGSFRADHVRICYASPNLAVFGDAAVPGAGDPLAALIGLSPARIVRALGLAATTTELADDLGLAPSTVSHHLRGLLHSGTVESHRFGRAVHYRLSERGRELLRGYGGAP